MIRRLVSNVVLTQAAGSRGDVAPASMDKEGRWGGDWGRDEGDPTGKIGERGAGLG